MNFRYAFRSMQVGHSGPDRESNMRKEALGALAALLLGFVAMHPATAHGTYDVGVVAKQAAKLVADDLAGQRFGTGP